MELLKLKNGWYLDFYTRWKNFHIEPNFDVFTFYLHPEFFEITIFNFSLVINKHPNLKQPSDFDISKVKKIDSLEELFKDVKDQHKE